MRETEKLEVIILDPVRIKSNDDLAVENSQRRELDADALRSFLIVYLFEKKDTYFKYFIRRIVEKKSLRSKIQNFLGICAKMDFSKLFLLIKNHAAGVQLVILLADSAAR